MATGTIEERLAALEAEVAQIRAQLRRERPGVIGRTAPDFLDTMFGIHANSPNFKEVTASIEEEREKEREEARHAADDAN